MAAWLMVNATDFSKKALIIQTLKYFLGPNVSITETSELNAENSIYIENSLDLIPKTTNSTFNHSGVALSPSYYGDKMKIEGEFDISFLEGFHIAIKAKKENLDLGIQGEFLGLSQFFTGFSGSWNEISTFNFPHPDSGNDNEAFVYNGIYSIGLVLTGGLELNLSVKGELEIWGFYNRSTGYGLMNMKEK